MDKNPLNKGAFTENSARIGPVTRNMVQARARELALIAGRTAAGVAQGDYDQARRELTGESDLDRQDEILDAAPESQRWDPVPGSPGHQAPESASEDEDDEGRSESEQAVAEGVNEAEHDQMLQAARAAAKKDSREK
jgi:hypothetical protein